MTVSWLVWIQWSIAQSVDELKLQSVLKLAVFNHISRNPGWHGIGTRVACVAVSEGMHQLPVDFAHKKYVNQSEQASSRTVKLPVISHAMAIVIINIEVRRRDI